MVPPHVNGGMQLHGIGFVLQRAHYTNNLQQHDTKGVILMAGAPPAHNRDDDADQATKLSET